MRRKNREKRRSERVTASLPLHAGRATGMTRDVSASGIFFETETDYHIGSKISVALDLDTPWGKVMLRGRGKIVRVESHNRRVGVAVQFVDAKKSGRTN